MQAQWQVATDSQMKSTNLAVSLPVGCYHPRPPPEQPPKVTSVLSHAARQKAVETFVCIYLQLTLQYITQICSNSHADGYQLSLCRF